VIAVMGATGNTGSVVAESLIAAGQKVRVIGRSGERLQPFTARGAEPAIGDVANAGFLAEAFRGADAAYTMIPPDYRENEYLSRQDRIGAATVRALVEAKVKRVVLLSSLGAEHPSGTGPIVGLHRQEQRLKDTGLDVVSLRAGYFMENLYGSIGLMKAAGSNGGAIDPDVRFAVIAARDIGAAAAVAVQARAAGGFVVKELLGQRDLSMREITQVLGAAIGKPDLAYARVPDGDLTRGLIAAGFAPAVAASFVEMSEAINDGRVHTREGRNAGNTTPTSIEEFAAQFAEVYRRS
jgi:uncharacterized protein YbjT (DUF2867 family)